MIFASTLPLPPSPAAPGPPYAPGAVSFEEYLQVFDGAAQTIRGGRRRVTSPKDPMTSLKTSMTSSASSAASSPIYTVVTGDTSVSTLWDSARWEGRAGIAGAEGILLLDLFLDIFCESKCHYSNLLLKVHYSSRRSGPQNHDVPPHFTVWH